MKLLITTIIILFSFPLNSQQIIEISNSPEIEIFTKKGTHIYFLRESLDTQSNQKIELHIVEDFINNLKIKNNLIENKYGFLNFKFLSNGKEIGLKKGHNLKVSTPKNNLLYGKLHIFHSENLESKIIWSKVNNIYEEVSINLGGGINKLVLLHKDTIAKKLNQKNRNFLTKKEYEKQYTSSKSSDNVYPNFTYSKFKQIYPTHFIKVKDKINFDIKTKKSDLFSYDFNILYKNHKAIYQTIKFKNEVLNFKDIPIFKDTYLIVISEGLKNDCYYFKMKLDELKDNSTIKLNMKKIKKEKLKELFD